MYNRGDSVTAGRKPKYTEWLTPDGLTTIRGWARDKLTDEKIAERIGIHKATLAEWKSKFPELNEAIKKGRTPVIEEVEDTAYKSAIGYYVEETTTVINKGEDGKERAQITKHKRWVKPEPALICYLLNNMKREKFSNNPKQEEVESEVLKTAREILGGINSVIN